MLLFAPTLMVRTRVTGLTAERLGDVIDDFFGKLEDQEFA